MNNPAAFSLGRVGAMVRYTYLLRSSWPRILEMIDWPAVQMLTRGFLQTYLVRAHGLANGAAIAAGALIGGVLLWDILLRGQQGFSFSFLEEMWSRNIPNLPAAAHRIRRRLDGDEFHKAHRRRRSGDAHGDRIFRLCGIGTKPHDNRDAFPIARPLSVQYADACDCNHGLSFLRCHVWRTTWVKTNMAPLRGWGPRGQRLRALVPYGHWKTMTFLAALRHNRIDAPWVVDGPINGELAGRGVRVDYRAVWEFAHREALARPHANEIIRKSRERGGIHGITVKAAHNTG
jgi:hypothetical protein